MTDTANPPAPARRRGRKLFVAAAAVVLLSGGGGGFWWWTYGRAQAADGPPAPKAVPTSILPLEPFVVNLADRQASRFLRVTLRLVVDEGAEAKNVEKDAVRLTKVRSAILELLTTQSSDTLVTPEGKNALKLAVAERSASVLNVEIRDVLFTEFVVQF